jgi:hypothetical protein
MSKAARAPLTTTGAFNKPAPEPASKPASTGSRTGKKAAPFWMPAPAKKQLDYLTIERETTQQALLTEALNDLFRKYGREPIA